MRFAYALLFIALVAQASPPAIDNDASCDIADLPAATLLLPYFEVDIESQWGTGETTIFTVTNVSHLPQVARVTLWTDRAYPVITFNMYLTGYDVQSINLYDVFVRRLIAPFDGSGSAVSPVGSLSGTSATREYDNPLLDETHCDALVVEFSEGYLQRLQRAFTTGSFPTLAVSPGCSEIGGTHRNATGYATIDVVGSCNNTDPTDASYFSEDIRFDNVLNGDYMQVNGNHGFAQGETMVHIRAVPEGGIRATGSTIPGSRQVSPHLLRPLSPSAAERTRCPPAASLARRQTSDRWWLLDGHDRPSAEQEEVITSCRAESRART